MSKAKPIPSSSTKRELLLDTALALFSRHGYHAVGIDTVLAKAGVAKMTLYNHFKSFSLKEWPEGLYFNEGLTIVGT